MSILILPICGESSRYPNMPPKWSIVHNNKTMLEHSISGIPLDFFEEIVIIKLKKHKYPTINYKHKTIELENQTKSQAETVHIGLQYIDKSKHIIIKDCDNYFNITPIKNNFVAYCNLSGEIHNAENKSYIEINEHNLIINIVEKQIISDHFCCGMYSFLNAKEYIKYYDNNVNYVSDIIFKMLLNNVLFFPILAQNYIDWGTLQDWERYTK